MDNNDTSNNISNNNYDNGNNNNPKGYSKDDIYRLAKEFKRKYPSTIAFRLRAHSKLVKKFIGSDEEVKYVFLAQKNFKSYDIVNTNIIVLTNKRLLVATKRFLFGYFYRAITPDMFNDLTLRSGILWGKVVIDTIKELVILSNIDKHALTEIEQSISEVMMEEKKKYLRESIY